jgi:hypothetical protein
VRGCFEDGGWQLQTANEQVKILLSIITTIGHAVKRGL